MAVTHTKDLIIQPDYTVNDILNVPFDSRTEKEKLRIAFGVKPRPFLKLSGINITENENITAEFKLSMYNNILWLTGCERRNALFCWPCLLFGRRSEWNTTGCSDITRLADLASKHEKSSIHTEAADQMHVFLKRGMIPKDNRKMNSNKSPSNETTLKHSTNENLKIKTKTSNPTPSNKITMEHSKIKNPTAKYKIEQPKGTVHLAGNENLVQFSHDVINSEILAKEKDAEVIKKLIGVCCSALQRSHSNKNFSQLLEPDKYVAMLQLFKTYDEFNACIFKNAANLIQKSPLVIDAVFDAIVKLVQLSIKKEIQSSKFVALVLNQHGESDSELKISVILRYIKNNMLSEHFAGFIKLTDRMSVDVLYNHFQAVLQKYGIGNKICALSLDGAVLHSKNLIDFLDKVRRRHPYCLFVPWHGHSVNYVLQQSLSSLPECKIFLVIIKSIQEYFQRNCELLKKLINEECPILGYIFSGVDIISPSVSNRFVSPYFIIAIKNFRQQFISLFDCIIKKYPKENADVIKAIGYQKYLNQLHTVFLLEVLTKIFNSTDTLNISLKNNDYKFCNGQRDNIVNDIKVRIAQLPILKYNDIWKSMKNIFPELNDDSVFNRMKSLYRSQFNEILNLMITEISIRYEPIVKLTFLNMFSLETNSNLEHFSSWARSIKETKRFDEEQFHIELKSLLRFGANTRKSIINFRNFVSRFHLKHKFKCIFDVIDLKVVMLLKPVSHRSGVSLLRAIEKWCDKEPESVDYLSILHIEYDIFKTLKQLPTFNDDVVSVYRKT